MPVDRSYSLSLVRGLTAAEVTRLKKAGVDSTAELLAATSTRYAEQKLARSTGVTLDRMREAVNRADLMRVSGMGAARADLFENAGINSAKELAQRNPATLAAVLERYVKAHPELNYRLPSPTTVASIVANAKSLASPTPVQPLDMEGAAKKAAEGLHQHIDKVLFSDHADGAQFRDAILGWRPSTEWPLVQRQMHQQVDAFVNDPLNGGDRAGYDDRLEDAKSFHIVGRLFGLYTEVSVEKATGKVSRVYVEID